MSEKEDLILSQQEIAKRIGCSPSAVHYIINGDREVSKAMAVNLMSATGVAAIAWLFPEWFYNPYIPFDGTFIDGRLWRSPTINLESWERAREELLSKSSFYEDVEEFMLKIKKGPRPD